MTGLPAGTDYQVCFGLRCHGRVLGCARVRRPVLQQPADIGHADPGDRDRGCDHDRDQRRPGGRAGAISGTVTDAGGTHHGLANVWVNVSSPSTGAYGYAMTAADGSYTVTGLAAGTDYQVCFYASGATGGSSDARGYVDQCYNNQPTSGTPTPVTVTLGATKTGIKARAQPGGRVQGSSSGACDRGRLLTQEPATRGPRGLIVAGASATGHAMSPSLTRRLEVGQP